MKLIITMFTLLIAAQSFAAVTTAAGKCEKKVSAAAERAIVEEDASGINEIIASEYEENIFIAGYSFPECYGSVSVKIQPIKSVKKVNGDTAVIDCKIISAEDDQDPNCG